MQRRAQLALALVLVLMLAPLAGAACGVRCLATASPLPMPAAASPQHCVRAFACCPSTAPVVCSAAQAPETIAALLSASSGTADAPAFALPGARSFPHSLSTQAAHRIDGAPPGPPDNVSPIPLRI